MKKDNRKNSYCENLKDIIRSASWATLLKLKKGNIAIKFLTDNVGKQRISSWQKVISNPPSDIFAFCRCYLILTFPTKIDFIPLCCIMQIQKLNIIYLHTLGLLRKINANVIMILFFLQSLTTWRMPFLIVINYCTLFLWSWTDINLLINNILYVTELTICFENNLNMSRNYKQTKFEKLKVKLRSNDVDLVLRIEFSVIGFPMLHLTYAMKLLYKLSLDIDCLIQKCSEVCCRTLRNDSQNVT